MEAITLTKEERRQIQNTQDKQTIREQLLRDKTLTWIHPDGAMARQIDYIMVDNKYRNAVKRAWAEHGWRGNMEQHRRHAVIRVDITLNLMKNTT